MDLRLNVARMGQVTRQRNALAGLLVAVLALNILQVIERMTVSEKIILLPPDIRQDIWVSKNRVSDSFLEEWTVYMSALLLNVSAETITYQRDLTLRNVSPESYHDIKAQFDEDKKRLYNNRSATTFSPVQVEVDSKNLSAKITGLLSTYVGKEKVSEHKETFVLRFVLKEWGSLQLLSFNKEGENSEEKTNEGK
jgi:conjugal transfer pilus assembly protein TraE